MNSQTKKHQRPNPNQYLDGLNFKFLFEGETGISQTINIMADLAREVSGNPEFCIFTQEQLGNTTNDGARIEILRRFVENFVRYVEDPPEYEFVKHPFQLMDEIQGRGYAEGDCDDHVTLLAAMLTCQRLKNSILALELPEIGDGLEGFNHVVNGIPTGKQDELIILDTSVKDRYQGYQIGKTMRVDVL